MVGDLSVLVAELMFTARALRSAFGKIWNETQLG